MESSTVILGTLQPAFSVLLNLSLHGSFVVVTVLMLQRFFDRFVSPRWIYAIWILVIIRFILVAAPASSFSFQNWLHNKQPYSVASETLVQNEFQNDPSSRWIVDKTSSFQDVTFSARNENSISMIELFATLWLLGVFVLLWRLGNAWVRTKQLIRFAYPAGSTIQEVLDKAQVHANYYSKIEVLITDHLKAPAATGMIKQKILLPSWCVEELSIDEMYCVVLHELTHLKKKDIWVQLAAHSVSIAHWFNPLVALALGKLEVYREMACDQQSIELLAKSNINNAYALYGNVIIKVATHCSEQSQPATPIFVGRFVDSDKHKIKQRIAMLVQKKPRRVISSWVATIVVMLIVAVGYTSAQTADQPGASLKAHPVRTGGEIAIEPARAYVLTSDHANPKHNPPLLAVSQTALAEKILIDKNEVKILEFNEPIPELLVANPEVIQVTPKTAKELIVLGKSVGQTHLSITFASGEKKTFNVGVGVVEPDLVKLQLKIITLDTAKLRELKLEFSDSKPFVGENSIFYVDSIQQKNDMLELVNQMQQGIPGVESVQAPTIVTIMSHEAAFFSGGELPLEIETNDGNKKIEFKPFGTQVRIKPVPTDNPNQIDLQVRAEFSKLKDSRICIQRRLNTSLRAEYGSTLAMVCSFTDNGTEKQKIVLVTPELVDNP